MGALQMLRTFGGNESYPTTLTTKNVLNGTVSVFCLRNAQSSGDHYSVFISNFNGAKLPIEANDIVLSVSNVDEQQTLSKVTMYRIDTNHTNPIATWKAQQSPEYPTAEQLRAINDSSMLVGEEVNDWKTINATTVQFDITVPVYGVVLLDMQF